MKRITITEEQFSKLLEVNDAGNTSMLDGGSDVHNMGNGEVSNQVVMTDKDGEREFSDPLTTDKVSKQLTNQNPMTRRGSYRGF